MADDVSVNTGSALSGATNVSVAADEILGIKYQRVKLVLGADGVNGGDVSSANPMPISAASLPLPTGAATGAAQTTTNTSLSSIDTSNSAGNVLLGAVTETAPATDTASSGLNGRFQRLSQRITSLIALLPSALVGGRLDVNVGNTPAVTVSGVATSAAQTTTNTSLSNIDADIGAPADTSATTDTGTFSMIAFIKRTLQNWTTLQAKLPALGAANAAASFPVTLANDGVAATLLGAVTETAPATDTASSGLNGRMQRVAQRLTSLIALLPAALVSGRLDVNIGASPNALSVNRTRGSSSTVTSVSGSATSIQVIAAGASRMALSFYNDSTVVLYLRAGSGAASTTDYSVQLAAGAFYESPEPAATLEFRGIWSSATGAVKITEVT